MEGMHKLTMPGSEYQVQTTPSRQPVLELMFVDVSPSECFLLTRLRENKPFWIADFLVGADG